MDRLALGPALVAFTDRSHGDLGHTGAWVEVHEIDPAVAARRAAVLERPWSWLRQVHGSAVVVVDRPGAGAGEVGDALVTSDRGAALAVLTADCAPVALASPEGVVGAVHAGWRGLVAGVVQAAADVMRAHGARSIQGAVGPCIGPECYEFGADDLDALADRFGPQVRSSTADGRPALDLRVALAAALDVAGVETVEMDRTCTACSPAHYSHRARGELERQATVVWLP